MNPDDFDFKPKPVIKSVRFPRALARRLLAVAQDEGVPFTRVVLVFCEKMEATYREKSPRTGPLPDFPEPKKKRSKKS